MAIKHSTDMRAEFPATELEKYRGQWVAFASDGSRILAAGESEILASQAAEASGYAPAEYILEPIPIDDTQLL